MVRAGISGLWEQEFLPLEMNRNMSLVWRVVCFHNFSVFFFLAVAVISAGGCSTIFDARSQKKEIMAAYRAGNFPEAEKLLSDKVKSREGSRDELMWRLEEGSLFLYMGEYRKSLQAFEKAENVIADYEKRAEVNLRQGGAEAGSMLTNPNAIPYKGSYCEKIMLNAFKALDYFALGMPEDARVELRRMYERQKEAAKRFQDEIEEADKAIERKKYKKAEIFEKVKEYQAIRKKIDSVSNKALGDFTNPFATYLSAIGYLSDNDYSGAAVDFRNLYRMDNSNEQIARDFLSCLRTAGERVPDELKSMRPFKHSLSENVVYVIFANGLAAARKGITIHLFLPPPVTGYTGVAFPVLEYYPLPYKCLYVTDSQGNEYHTHTIANMDSVISREYKKALPVMITRIFLSVAAKETANFFALQAAKKQGDAAYWGTVAAISAYKYAFNTADTRCWQMLPKEYQIAHFQKPGDGVVNIRAGSSEGCVSKSIKLDSSKKMSIIYVNSPGKGVLSVDVFEFN
jgi:hypothetical protein